MMKIGDKVYLKSGSPELTVVSINGERVTVQWHLGEGDALGAIATAEFPEPCLVSEARYA